MTAISKKASARRGWRAAAVAAVMVAALAPTAGAQVFYMYPGAPPVKTDQPAVGVDIGIGDNLFRAAGYGRFNVNKVSDIGIEVLLDKMDTIAGAGEWRFGLAADYKYAIVPENTEMPFDLSVNGGFGFESGGDVTNILVPLGGLISRPVLVGDDKTLLPYGGVYILIAYTKWDLPAGAFIDDSDWDVDVELRGGAAYFISDTAAVHASLFIGSGTKFFIGVNFLL